MSARVDIYQDETGEWRFRPVSANGQVPGQQGYRDAIDARRGFGDLCDVVDTIRGRTDSGWLWCLTHNELHPVPRKDCRLTALFFEGGDE